MGRESLLGHEYRWKPVMPELWVVLLNLVFRSFYASVPSRC